MQVGSKAPVWAPAPESIIKLKRFALGSGFIHTPEVPIEFVVFWADLLDYDPFPLGGVRLMGVPPGELNDGKGGVAAVMIELESDFELVKSAEE